MLDVGETAPDFEVTGAKGERIHLKALAGKKNVVLYFYPRAFTKVCTRETCGFQDMYEELARDYDAEIIGVSLDSSETHQKFAEENGVEFAMVSDKKIAKDYGALGSLRSLIGMVKRITYVIDKKGKIAGVFSGELSAAPHLEGVRKLLQGLAKKGEASDAAPAG